jgi:hypothetical protein
MARFIRRGVTKIRFSPALADYKTGATRAEITSSIDLTDSVAEINGWQLEGSTVPVPDMSSTFEKSIPGTDSAADSSLSFYEDDDTDVIETLLPKGTEGFVLLFRKGDKPTSKSLDIFPTQVTSRAAAFSAGNDPARFDVRFSITDEPALDTTIPAAV